ncbi:MAG: DNA starvation/stationary phase protection protein [Verrucomicrobiota bacterium]
MAKKKTPTNPHKKVVDSLRVVLADTYALMGQTHLCHWNVEGPGFFALHTAFEQQYTELFTAADEIAERIRALDSYAPGGLRSLADIAKMNELSEKVTAEKMVASLAQDHGKLIKDASKTRDLADEAGDSETEDLMIARIQVHEKTVWMLKSFLK